jgi:hypothetical protein
MRLSCTRPRPPTAMVPALDAPYRHGISCQASAFVLCQADQIPDWKWTISTSPKVVVTYTDPRRTPVDTSMPSRGPASPARSTVPVAEAQGFVSGRLAYQMPLPWPAGTCHPITVVVKVEFQMPPPSRLPDAELPPCGAEAINTSFSDPYMPWYGSAVIQSVAVYANPTGALLCPRPGREFGRRPRWCCGKGTYIPGSPTQVPSVLGESRPPPSFSTELAVSCLLGDLSSGIKRARSSKDWSRT